MSNQQAPQAPVNTKKTAAQRIESLENAFMSLYHTCDNMARDLLTSKEAIKLLGNKLDAVQKLTGLKDDDIVRIMIENNIQDLKEKIDGLAKNGVLTAEEEIKENSFVVGREIDAEGVILNPRLQFAMKAMPATTQEKLKGAKVGSIVTVEEGKLRFEVQESYAINPPKKVEASHAAEVPAEVTEAPAEVKPEAAQVGNA